MAAVYAKMREDHEDIKRLLVGVWGGLGWGSDQVNGPYQYWPALEGYCQGEWVEGLERSLVKEGWGWIDGQGAQTWRAGDSRLTAITGARLGDVGFSTSSKLDLWMRGVKFRSELVGPDGTTVLPWGEIPGWVGWLPPKCSRTSPELRKQRILEQTYSVARPWDRSNKGVSVVV